MARPKGHRLSASAWDDVLTLLKLNQTQAAERIGLPAATIRSLKGGFHKASEPQAMYIARSLGVDPVTLFPTYRKQWTYVDEAAA